MNVSCPNGNVDAIAHECRSKLTHSWRRSTQLLATFPAEMDQRDSG